MLTKNEKRDIAARVQKWFDRIPHSAYDNNDIYLYKSDNLHGFISSYNYASVNWSILTPEQIGYVHMINGAAEVCYEAHSGLCYDDNFKIQVR